jgi:hypothetical protein
MTLTVRSASVTGATTASRALTHAEMDANWAHVIQSANLNFLPSGIGGVAETVQGHFRWEVHVTDYMTDAQRADVRAYGFTLDVTAAFQAAHDALPTSGGDIIMPAGGYLLNQTTQSAQFNINKSNVRLIGSGWGTQIKHTATGTVTGNQGVVMLRPTSAILKNIVLANFRITGPTTNSGATVSGDTRVVGLLINDALTNNDITDVLVDGVLIEGMETACFALTSGASTGRNRRIKFSRCWARTCRGDGFNDFGGGTFDVTLDNCVATDLDGFGMEMAPSGDMLIQGCIVRRTGQSGIGLEYNTTVGANRRIKIIGNTISDITTTGYPNASGISLGQLVNPFNTEISGNSIYRTGGHGIVVNLTPSYISIHDNDIYDVGGGAVNMRGIQMPGAATYTTVQNNTIITTASGYAMQYGIVIAGTGSATNLIADNRVVGETIQKVYSANPTIARRLIQPFTSSTQTQNITTGVTDLTTYTMVARTLEADYQGVKVRIWGITAANGNNKTVIMYFGNLQLLTTGALAANNKDWYVEATILRTGSAFLECIATGQFNGALIQSTRTSSVNRDYTIDNIIKCTGTGGATGDILQTGMTIEFIDEKGT